MIKAQKQEKQETLTYLRSFLKPGTTVSTVLMKVSRSGMYRHIKVVYQDRDISGIIATALDRKWHDDGSLGVGGCGMDMGYSIIYSLSYSLYPDGFDCIGEGCPANDHANGVEAAHHSDGGYALKHKWL